LPEHIRREDEEEHESDGDKTIGVFLQTFGQSVALLFGKIRVRILGLRLVVVAAPVAIDITVDMVRRSRTRTGLLELRFQAG
jgi:hypothetical protein